MSAEAFLDTNVLLYTEDLNHGQIYGTVQVQNPFLSVSASSV